MSKQTTAEKLAKKYHKAPYVSDLRDLLYQSAEKYAGRYAFRLKDRVGNIYGITYHDFKEDVISLGTSLLSAGMQGKAIAVMGKNSYQWAVSYLAAAIIGVVVPIDKELPSHDVINFMNSAEAQVLLADDKYIDLLFKKENHQQIQNTNTLYVNFNSDKDTQQYLSYRILIEKGQKQYKEGDHLFDQITIDPDQMHILLFTSGTTGNAKGVCLSHQNIIANIRSTYGIVKVRRDDQVLSILPIHHTYECTLGYLLIIYSGACISYCEGLRYINQNISEFRPSIILCVPLLLEKMHKKISSTVSKTLPKYDKEGTDIMDNLPGIIRQVVKRKVRNTLGGKLRAFIVGAAPLNPTLVTSFQKLGVRSLQGYGLTECAPLVAGNTDFYLKADAVGLPIPDVTYKIDHPDETGTGEILVQGPNVMLGYYKNEEETKKVIKDGWFYTGDLGRVDENGWLYVTGRCKTVIVTKNGKNIYPEEIEYYLNDNPLIEESLVSGLSGDKDDEMYVNAQVLPNMDAIKDYMKGRVPQKEEVMSIMKSIIASVNEKLPNYKHIKSFKIREEEFEKTTTQKIKRYGENLKNKEETKKKTEKKKK